MRIQPSFSPESTSGLEGNPVPPDHAHITEMFSGIQGEGPYVGVRQIFVRFGGCDLRCSWCDTPMSLTRRGPGRYETHAGAREFETRANPILLSEATGLLSRLNPGQHHSVTFTGGEPLLQPEAVTELADTIHGLGGRAWVETHGARVRELERVIDAIDVVAMDIKVPSSCGEEIPMEVHREFLSIAAKREVFAKLVVTPDTLDEEVFGAVRVVGSVSKRIPFILQPVTPFGRVKRSPSAQHMLELQSKCLRLYPNVRVIPQTHKFQGQM